MNRSSKLYERLDELEEQYARLLRVELEAILEGGPGNYLGRKLRDDWDILTGRRTADPCASQLQRIEAEILRLRRKLGESMPGKLIGTADALVARIRDAGEWSPGCNRSWLRSALAELSERL